jgi:MFS family permease
MAGLSVQTAALMWQVYDITGSALPLAFIGLARFLPSLAISFFAGAVADTSDRKMILALSQIPPIVVSVLLWALTASGAIAVGIVYPAVALVGAAAAFEGPARQSILPQVVPRTSFQRAVALATTVQQLTLVIGPAASGLIIARFGVAPAYLLHVVLLLLGLAFLVGVHVQPAASSRATLSMNMIREGIVFIWTHPAVFAAMALDMVAVIFAGAEALLPIYARDILDVGAFGYGLLSSSKAVGMLIMALSMTLLPSIVRTGRALVITIALYGLGTIAFGLSTWFPLSLLFYGLTAACDQVSVVMRQNIIQLGTPDALRGRVSSVNQVFIGASNQLGAMESGLVATWTNSAVFAVVFGGVACLVAVIVIGVLLPALWRHKLEVEPLVAPGGAG